MTIKKNRLASIILFVGVFSNLFLWDLKTFYISQINEYNYYFLSSLRFIIILPLLFILKKIKKEEIKRVAILFLFLLTHYIIIYFLYSVKLEFINIIYCFAISLLFLIVIKFKKLIFFYIKKSYQLFLFILLALTLINYLFYKDNISEFWQACSIFNIKNFFFKEYSHFAYLSVSILLYFLFTSRIKFFLFLFLVSVNLSTTIIISLFLNSLIFLKNLLRFKYILLFLIFFSLLFFLYKKDCNQRLLGLNQTLYNYLSNSVSDKNITEIEKYSLEDNKNLTFLVYKNNLIISLQSIKNNILGWGVNNYSKAFFYYSDLNADDISKYYGTSLEYKILNYNDGRSNFFKIIVEFGVFIFIFIFLFFYFFLSKNISLEKKIIFIPAIITQFLSGSGYFNSGFILFALLIYQELLVVKKKIF